MADVVAGGHEITFDLNAITHREYNSLFDAEQSDEDANEIVARSAGLTPDDLGNMGQLDWRRVMKAFFRVASQPLDDPN